MWSHTNDGASQGNLANMQRLFEVRLTVELQILVLFYFGCWILQT